MSHNVTGFALKKLDSLTLPYATVLEASEGDVNIQDDVHTFDGFPVEGMKIVGTQEDDRLNVTDLNYYGEFSGRYWDTFEELLTQSTGVIKARVVWEGGDSVEIVTITNGAIERSEM